MPVMPDAARPRRKRPLTEAASQLDHLAFLQSVCNAVKFGRTTI
jgi:hypothetical protein